MFEDIEKRERHIKKWLTMNQEELPFELNVYFGGKLVIRTKPDGIDVIDEEGRIKRVVDLIQKNLTDDLLRPRYRGLPGKYAGHCYVATECFYYLYGREHSYKPKCFRYLNGDTHWWLEKDGDVLDITEEQLSPGFDYSKGHSQFFMCYPSKRCKELARRAENTA